MAVTQNNYTGNGSTVLYSFSFPYLEATDIRVSVNGVDTSDFTLANATTVQFNTAPANGASIRIYRLSDDSQLAATFYPGSAIRSQDLNENFQQTLYKIQEVNNYALQDSGNITLQAAYTFVYAPSGPTPVNNSHLVTKAYVDSRAMSTSVPDGNRGDITVSGGSVVWTLNNGTVTTAKILDGAVTPAKLSTSYLDAGTAATTYAPLASPTLTGQPYVNGSYRGNTVTVPALNIDCSAGNYFIKAISGASTFTISNIPASRAYSFTLELTVTSGAVTWFSGVEWPSSTAPTLATGKTHLLTFVTDDGGTRWRGASLLNYTT
jgi:hypothetical protein